MVSRAAPAAVMVVLMGDIGAVAALPRRRWVACSGGVRREDCRAGEDPQHRRRGKQRDDHADPTTARLIQASKGPQYPVTQVTSGDDRTAGVGETCDRNVTLFQCQSS